MAVALGRHSGISVGLLWDSRSCSTFFRCRRALSLEESLNSSKHGGRDFVTGVTKDGEVSVSTKRRQRLGEGFAPGEARRAKHVVPVAQECAGPVIRGTYTHPQRQPLEGRTIEWAVEPGGDIGRTQREGQAVDTASRCDATLRQRVGAG